MNVAFVATFRQRTDSSPMLIRMISPLGIGASPLKHRCLFYFPHWTSNDGDFVVLA